MPLEVELRMETEPELESGKRKARAPAAAAVEGREMRWWQEWRRMAMSRKE